MYAAYCVPYTSLALALERTLCSSGLRPANPPVMSSTCGACVRPIEPPWATSVTWLPITFSTSFVDCTGERPRKLACG